jgi:hypothetical protein
VKAETTYGPGLHLRGAPSVWIEGLTREHAYACSSELASRKAATANPPFKRRRWVGIILGGKILMGIERSSSDQGKGRKLICSTSP